MDQAVKSLRCSADGTISRAGGSYRRLGRRGKEGKRGLGCRACPGSD